MHFGLICNEYPPAPHGGTGSSYRDLAEGLVAAGHCVTVVGVYPAKRLALKHTIVETLNGVGVVRMPVAPKWMRYRLGALWDRRKLSGRLAREHARVPFDLIESPDYAGWLRFGGPCGVPTVVRIRGSNLFFDTELQRPGDIFGYRLEREALRRAQCVAAVSRYAARRTLEICRMAQRECTVIYNAVDTEVFAPSPTVQVEPGLVVFVNSLNPKKGIEQLIVGMHHVWADHPDARLVAIGQDTQKPEGGCSYVDRLLKRVRPEFRQRVTFTGRLPREGGVLDHLRRAAVCCYPSHMETFGIAAVEAMAVGRPTIYSTTGPGPEIIEDGVSGLLCNPYDPADIGQKIVRLLDDQWLADRLGSQARRRVEQLFDTRQWISRNLDFYLAAVKAVLQSKGEM